MNRALFLRFVGRELRGSRGRLFFFVLCLATGVAAVTAVSSLVESLERGLMQRTREFLGADLEIQSSEPLPRGLDAALEELGATARSDLRVLVGTCTAEEARPGYKRSLNAQIHVLGGPYPLRGRLACRPQLPLAELLGPDTCVVEEGLTGSLGASLGDRIYLRGGLFTIAGVVSKGPADFDFSAFVGPRVFVSEEAAKRKWLDFLHFGQRRHVALANLDGVSDGEQLDALVERLESRLGEEAGPLRIRHWRSAQPGIVRVLRQVEVFLGLVALVSLVLGGLGVAQIVRAWLAARTPALAVLRCLGLRPSEVVRISLGAVLVLALLGSALGVLVGGLVPLLVPRILEGLVPPGLVEPFPPVAMMRGLLMGLLVTLAFTLPPLLALRRVPPARVLRAEAEPLPSSRWVRLQAGGGLILGLWLAAFLQTRDGLLALGFTAAIAAVAGILALGAWATLRTVRLLPRGTSPVIRHLPAWLKHGLAALARPGAGTVGAIVALGLGTMTLLGLFLVERSLTRELGAILPPEAPSVFLLEIPPGEWPRLEELLREHEARSVAAAAVHRPRLERIDGLTLKELREEEGGKRRMLRRGQRLAEMEEMPRNDEVLRGAIWSEPERAEVSLEERYADRLGVDVGSVLTLTGRDGGPEFELVVTSIRRVRWESFELNFFAIVEPGSVPGPPPEHFAVARLEPRQEIALQNRLAEEIPGAIVLRVRAIAAQVGQLVSRVTLGVAFLGAFTLLTGLVILVGTVASGTLRRRREVALLKTLGVRRRGVVALLGGEFALTGIVAGALGTAGAWGALHLLAQGPLGIEPWAPWWVLATTPLLTALLAAGCGLGGCARALKVRPLATLREA